MRGLEIIPMIFKKTKILFKFTKLSFVASVMTFFSSYLSFAQEMPTGANIQSGNVTISGSGSNHLIIDQVTNKSIINWDNFSINSSGRVDFNMPTSNSSSLNRVNGSTPSSISGKLNSNGKVMLVNPNGVIITPGAVVKTNSFTASSLDINNKDFLNEKYSFQGKKKSNGVKNGGTISVGEKGNVNLLGNYVSNSGTITARLGKISLGAGEKITLDFSGSGLMNIIIPSNKLGEIKDINGNTLKSLVTNNGTLSANGGLVELSAATANSLSMGSINLGSTSSISATTVNKKTGTIVLGGPKSNEINVKGEINVSGNLYNPSGKIEVKAMNVYQGGSLKASGSSGGKIDVLTENFLVLDGTIEANGLNGDGGDLIVMSENSMISSYNNLISVSGSNRGGNIRSIAKNYNIASGKYIAESNSGKGGNVDISADYVSLNWAEINASGRALGGKTRVGGEYLGGKVLTSTKKKELDGFIKRFGEQPKIRNAKQTIVGTNSKINVSSTHGKAGTAIVWSDEITDFSGAINANGSQLENSKDWIAQESFDNRYETSGGFVEISSSNLLRKIDLSRVKVKDGTLLLDPKNITVDGSSGSGSLSSGLRAQVYSGYFNDNLSFFGTVGGSSQHSSSSIRNRFVNDFTRVNYTTPGRNFAEYYSAEWRGFFKPPSTGSYRFLTSSDDASWLWLFDTSQASNWSNFISLRSKSNERVDNSRPHGIRTRFSSYFTLQADTYYPILAYFGERTGGDAMLIRWQGPGQGVTDNGTNVYFHNDLEFTSGAFTGITGGDISTVNAFATDTSASNTIGSSTIADLLTAGTDVYLRANQDITISNAITATGSSGGNLSFLAGRDITINGNITTANGDFSMRANTSTSYGVVNAQRGTGAADISNNATINAGTGSVSAIIDAGTGLTNDQPGSISLGNISAGSIVATGDSATGYITGTSLTASGSGTAINISGYDIGAISSINASNGNWRLSRLASNNSTMNNVPAASFIQYNYSNGDSVLGSGNGILHGYNPGAITKSYDYVRSGGSSLGYRAVKTYDGTTSTSGVTFGSATVVGANGLPSEVNVSLSSPSLTYDSKDFNDNNKTISASGAYTISSAAHSRHGAVYGLSTGTQNISNARIAKRAVIASGSRLYDATSTASTSDLSTIAGTVGNETLTLNGSGTLGDANVGPNKSITLGSLALADGSNGGLSKNYSLSSGTLTVGKRPITLSGKRTEKRGSRVVNARELKIRNLIDGETLRISGNGIIPNTSLETHTLAVDRLSIRDSSGSASNYTLVGGNHTFQIDLSKKKIVLDKLETFKKSGKKLMPKMVAARAAPAISVAAPRPTRAGGGGAAGGRGPVGGGTTGGGSSSSGVSSSGGNTNSGGSSDSGGTSESGEGESERGASSNDGNSDAI